MIFEKLKWDFRKVEVGRGGDFRKVEVGGTVAGLPKAIGYM